VLTGYGSETFPHEPDCRSGPCFHDEGRWLYYSTVQIDGRKTLSVFTGQKKLIRTDKLLVPTLNAIQIPGADQLPKSPPPRCEGSCGSSTRQRPSILVIPLRPLNPAVLRQGTRRSVSKVRSQYGSIRGLRGSALGCGMIRWSFSLASCSERAARKGDDHLDSRLGSLRWVYAGHRRVGTAFLSAIATPRSTRRSILTYRDRQLAAGRTRSVSSLSITTPDRKWGPGSF
jgi:hypothetical protein